jgi:hypothetical protein
MAAAIPFRAQRAQPYLYTEEEIQRLWLQPRAFHPRAAFDLGLITVYLGC